MRKKKNRTFRLLRIKDNIFGDACAYKAKISGSKYITSPVLINDEKEDLKELKKVLNELR